MKVNGIQHKQSSQTFGAYSPSFIEKGAQNAIMQVPSELIDKFTCAQSLLRAQPSNKVTIDVPTELIDQVVLLLKQG